LSFVYDAYLDLKTLKIMVMLKLFTTLLFVLLSQWLIAQNVGIGTNTPSNKLEINSAQKGNSGLKLTQLADTGLKTNYFSYSISDSLLNVNDFIVEDDETITVCDRTNNCINSVSPNGTVTRKFNTYFYNPTSICKDPAGNYYVLNERSIYKIDAGSSITTVYSTLPDNIYYTVVIFANNSLFVCSQQAILKVDSNGNTSVFSYTLSEVRDIVADNTGNLFYLTGVSIYKVTTVGISSVYLNSANTFGATALAINSSNELFFLNISNIYKVNAAGQESEFFPQSESLFDISINDAGELFVYSLTRQLKKIQALSNRSLSIDKAGNIVTVANPQKIVNNKLTIDIPSTFKYVTTYQTSAERLFADQSYAKISNVEQMSIGNYGVNNITTLKGLYTAIGTIGASPNIQKKSVKITLPYSIPNAFYTVQVTLVQEGIFEDVLTVSATDFQPGSFKITVYRVDGNGWAQNLKFTYTVLAY
jgi:hypothetical protein